MTKPLPDDLAAQQADLAAGLQLKWLKRMDKMLKDDTITSTDMATLARVLLANGWNLDPARLPSGLRAKLTSHIDPADLDEQDGMQQVVGVIGSR
jgi:hypothetical protein